VTMAKPQIANDLRRLRRLTCKCRSTSFRGR
jgi:hypothetical protein